MASADLKINVTADTKGAESSLKGLDDQAGKTGGGMGLLAGAGMAAAGAFAALAIKGVLAYQDLGISVGKFSDATGISTESSSRLIEVAGDLGISSETLQGGIGKMEKTLGANAGAFDEYGVVIARNKDGQIDANETFINAIDALNGIKDPAKRAAAGAEIFGKGWAGMAEIVSGGADTLRDSLAAVSDQKIFDDEKVQKARDLRASFDTLKDSGEDIVLQLGSVLAPIVSKLAESFAKVIDKLGPVIDLIGGALVAALEVVGPIVEGLATALGGVAKAISWVGDAIGGDGLEKMNALVTGMKLAQQKADDLKISQEQLKQMFKDAGGDVDVLNKNLDDMAKAQTDNTAAAEDAKVALEDEKQATEDLKKALEDQKKATEDALKAHEDLIDAYRSAADSNYAVQDANDDYLDGLAELDAKIIEAEGDQRKLDAIYRDSTKSAAALADATVQQKIDQDAANGTTTTAKDKMDTWNTSMLTAASTATGPVRQSIIDYIAEANGIPASKATEISAQIEKGNLAYASALLDQASATRTASIDADADQTAINDVEAKLTNLARPRNVDLRPIHGAYASGTTHSKAGVALVGEQGPELIDLPAGTVVHNASETQSLLNGSTSSVGNTYNDNRTIYMTLPPAINAVAVAQAIRSYNRRGGRQ